MKLTSKLLAALNRVFDKDPKAFLALRVNYVGGGLVWTVAEGVLTLTVTGGTGASVVYTLSDYSLKTLVDAIAARTGFTVSYLDAAHADLSARVLLDGSGDQAVSNGNALLGYTSLLWAFGEAIGVQLQGLRDQVGNMLLQMSTTTAEAAWLDELGSYYGVPRQPGEVDAIYAGRIIAETLRPVSNNIALESAIEDYTGQPCTVVDVTVYIAVFPVYDATIHYNGAFNYATVGQPNYGLFDVSVAYDILAGGDISTFLTSVEAIVEKLRAGGTHMRALALSSAASPIMDDFTAPTDAASVWAVSSAMADTFTGPTDAFPVIPVALAGLADTLTGPTEGVTGTVYTVLRTEAGVVITQEDGSLLEWPIGDLFA